MSQWPKIHTVWCNCKVPTAWIPNKHPQGALYQPLVYYFCVALLNVLASEKCIRSQLQMAHNLTQQYVWWAWIIWNDVKHRRALSLATMTRTVRAMPITVRAEQNAITGYEKKYVSQEKLNSWRWNMKASDGKVIARLRHRTVPRPYWWLPQPKFCSPGWFDSCSVSSSAA